MRTEDRQASELYQIQNLEKSSGLFFEKIGTSKFFNSNWKLISYLNISALEDKLEIFKSILKQTSELCHNPSISTSTSCTTSLGILQRFLPSIEEQDTSFKDLVGHMRHKRGIINGIGTAFKVLFGTLDSDDAELYNQAINDISNDEKDFSNLLKTQSHIVQSTISNFNSTLMNLHHTEEVFNSNLLNLKNLTKSINNTLQAQHLKQSIESHITLLLLVFTEINKEYSTLIHSILLAKQNILHPSILTPNQLVKELGKTKKYLARNTGYPLPISRASAYELLKLCSLSVLYIDSKLIFLIYVPITDNNVFTLYHILPLPIPVGNNNTHMFINPSSDYISVSVNKMTFTPVDNLQKCKELSNNTYICPRENPLYNTFGQSNCETELLQNHISLPKSCDVRVSYITSEIWYQLKDVNKWLFVIPELTHMTVDCGQDGIHDITLYGTGFLTLSHICKAYTKSITLFTVNEQSSTVTSRSMSYLPTLDITLKIDNTPILSPLDFQPINSQINDLNDLKTASIKLDQISKLADDITHKTKLTRKLGTYDIVLTLVCIFVIILLTYYFCKCFNSCRSTVCRPFESCTTLMLRHSEASSTQNVNVELRNRNYSSLPILNDPENQPLNDNVTKHKPQIITTSSPSSPRSRRSARLKEKI